MDELVVLGAGESGTGAAQLAKKQGFKVFVSDRGKIKQKYKDVLLNLEIKWEEEQHNVERILQAKQIVKSPGIPDTMSLIENALAKGIPVISEIEFASKYTDATLIGITGSNGKTTTTLLTYHILKNAGLNVGLAGNVGESFAKQVADCDFDYYVLELSSFQLDGIKTLKLDIAMLLNITPDHLDRYDNDIKNYIDSKFRVCLNQTKNDHFIYCADDEIIMKEIKQKNLVAQQYPFTIKSSIANNGASIINEKKLNIIINHKLFNMSIYDLALEGKHNIYNSMASGIASRILEVRNDIVRDSLSDFQNIEHRLEFVVKIHGIDFVNDSKATNVNSTWYALETMTNEVIWIVGGVDKGNDYSALEGLVKEKVKAIICLGEDNTKIINAFEDLETPMYQAKTMAEAVALGYKYGNKGDTVLLSPACASFDMYENYEERGRQFKETVRGL